MSIPILNEVYDEVRRLAIAGSVVAPGDFRLTKLVPQLEQMGQKAAVFAKMAEGAKRVIESDEKTSSAALLELTTLVTAVLYTQGRTGAEGELEPLAPSAFELPRVQASARALKPLIEALTTTGSGRLEIIRDAQERGVFQDLRLIAPALRALDDPYPDIAQLVADEILPMYGRAILPSLQESFDPSGKSGHPRRLRTMHRIDPVVARSIGRAALESGSKEVRVAALECLGDSPEDLPLLLERIKSRSKEERAAVFTALGRSAAAEAIQALGAALESDRDIEVALDPIRLHRDPSLMSLVIEACEAQLALLLAAPKGDREATSKLKSRMHLLLQLLRGRTDDAAGSLLQKAFAARPQLDKLKGMPSDADVVHTLIGLLADGPGSAQSVLAGTHADLPPDTVGAAFAAACACWTPAKVFEAFSPYVMVKGDAKKKKQDPELLRRQSIVDRMSDSHGYSHTPKPGALTVKLDPRWLGLAVELEDVGLVVLLATPGHRGARDLLSKSVSTHLSSDLHGSVVYGVLYAMVRIGHPEATDAIIKVLEHHSKSRHAYIPYGIGQLIPQLPPAEAVPKFDALLPRCPDWMIDQLIDGISELKRAPSA